MRSWILSRLNILCTIIAKPRDTISNDSPFTVIRRVTATYLSFSLPDIIETRSDSCIRSFSALSRIRDSFSILSPLNILCTKCSKRILCQKQFTTHASPVVPPIRVHKRKNTTPPSRSDLSLVNFLLLNTSQQKVLVL